MKTIWKFPLQVTDEQFVEMPPGSEILCVQTQRETPTLWARVNESNRPNVFKTIIIVGTGHKVPEKANLLYVGTFQIMDGSFVGHVFEAKI